MHLCTRKSTEFLTLLALNKLVIATRRDNTGSFVPGIHEVGHLQWVSDTINYKHSESSVNLLPGTLVSSESKALEAYSFYVR